jgi:transposase
LVRTVLNDQQWKRIAPELPGKDDDPGATAADNRLFVEAVLWIARTGRHGVICPTNSVSGTASTPVFGDGRQKGIWDHVFKALSDDPDFEYVLIDATHIRVHQHGTGAKGGLKNSRSADRVVADHESCGAR